MLHHQGGGAPPSCKGVAARPSSDRRDRLSTGGRQAMQAPAVLPIAVEIGLSAEPVRLRSMA